MLMTFSGEYLHAAPWSVAFQGHSNVSHGCTGMSTADADWLYHRTRIGDVVVTKGTDRMMTLKNGWGRLEPVVRRLPEGLSSSLMQNAGGPHQPTRGTPGRRAARAGATAPTRHSLAGMLMDRGQLRFPVDGDLQVDLFLRVTGERRTGLLVKHPCHTGGNGPAQHRDAAAPAPVDGSLRRTYVVGVPGDARDVEDQQAVGPLEPRRGGRDQVTSGTSASPPSGKSSR